MRACHLNVIWIVLVKFEVDMGFWSRNQHWNMGVWTAALLMQLMMPFLSRMGMSAGLLLGVIGLLYLIFLVGSCQRQSALQPAFEPS